MWLLFTVTILLTREVVCNFSTDEHDEEKKVKNEHDIHTFPQLQTTDVKIPAEKQHVNEETNGKQEQFSVLDSGKRRKRSIDEIGADQEKFTSDLEKRKRPLSSWFYWADKDAIPIKERSKESSQEKKTPRFSPWGGKRSGVYLSDPEFQQNRHVFNSWGGKRANEILKLVPQEKIAKLYALNRVGSDEDLELKRVLKSDLERKVPFNSWGGKRAFNSWGGKRQFNSWGGKREFNSWGGKRAFNSWGGKRELNNIDFSSPISEDLHQLEKNIVYPKRKEQYEKSQDKLIGSIEERRMPLVPKFESWGGKRFSSQEEADSSNSSENDAFRFGIPKIRSNRALTKREFQPWGGKRSPETIPDLPNDTVRRPASLFVRKVFFPWGG